MKSPAITKMKQRYEEMARHELYDAIDRLISHNSLLKAEVKQLQKELNQSTLALRREKYGNFKPRYRTDSI